ncbi:allene oxide cyclase barrel-like domain-containing protein [Catenulispora rubra]|uniref:allene oxide cyclase barrel-like domain-containing protein n=1 Tax=Catenulispora rubra TaxID=280293 RepID=UPI00189275B0|nr:hypothetical protein [Catenulispora rubra]
MSTALVVGVSGALAGSSFAKDASSGQADPTGAKAAGHSCQHLLQGWTELTLNYNSTGTPVPPGNEVGDAVIYNDAVFDQNDKQVGHAVGYVSIQRKDPADGHLISYYHATEDLPDGQFNETGTVDRTATWQGVPAVFRIEGTTGAYAGKHGYLTWRLLQVPVTINTRASLDLWLCD